MKKKKKIVVWILLLVLLGAVFAGLKMKNNRESAAAADSEEEAEEITVTDIDSDAIIGISFQMNGEEMSFSRENGIWSWDQDGKFPLNDSKISSVALQLSSITASRVIEDENTDTEEYGIDEPSNVVTIIQEDGTKMVLTVGDQNTSSYRWYICKDNDTSKVYMVSTAFGTMFPDKMMEWAESESLPSIEDENVTSVEVEGENHYRVSVDQSNAAWSVEDSEGNVHDTNDDSVTSLVSAVAALKYDELVEYNCDNFEMYGLEKPAAVIRVGYTEEQDAEDSKEEDAKSVDSESEETELENGDESLDGTASSSEITDAASTSEGEEEKTTIVVNKNLTLCVGGQDEEGNYYVTTEGSKEVHTMSSGKIETLTGMKAVDFYDMYIGMLNVADLKSLEVTLNGETKTIQRHVEIEESDDEDDSETETVRYLCDGAEIDKTAFTAFYSSAIGLKAQTKDRKLEAAADAEITLVFHMQNGDYTAAYSPYDSSFYLTDDIQGVPSLVNKNSVKTMIENFEALF